MKSIQDQFKAFNETKAFLRKIALTTTDTETETNAETLLISLPDDWEIEAMFRLYAEWQVRDCKHSPDPVEYSPTEGGWILWDETWTDHHGPFDTKQQALDACDVYAKSLNELESLPYEGQDIDD